ncbi:uncharacterized protein CCOS01_15532 [Colletotrichum costaricense]|uniref:Uncharacterized protein n=1 Tax=Colletotrichum costaricense TaxID=1209916 RepID=A0AAI9YHH0_9PEZI|nr:uncharacterized protein CCOS01_15532 [Colletotrichum costaricense]KAK1509438.1 hypothetical protein CCOS01_15532 [Colletotrichum costaricense]
MLYSYYVTTSRQPCSLGANSPGQRSVLSVLPKIPLLAHLEPPKVKSCSSQTRMPQSRLSQPPRSAATEYCCECCHCALITTPSDLPSMKSDSISPLPLSFYSRGSAAEPSRNGLAPGWLIGCVGGHAGISVRIPCKIKYYPPTKPRQFVGRCPAPISRWRDPGFLSAPQMDASTVQCSFARSMLLRLYAGFPSQTGGGALNPRVVCRRIMAMAHRQERGPGDCRGSHC